MINGENAITRHKKRTLANEDRRNTRNHHDAGLLKVALLGLSGEGADYLAAIRACESFQLVAAGDPDPQVRRASALSDGVRTYEDMRSLIVELAGDGLDLIFVALEPFQSREFVELAGQRGIGVFHKPPFARTVAEARELLSAFAENGPPFVVPRFWHYDDAWTTFLEAESHIGPIRAMSASVATQDLPVAWRGDSARSGGGALLNGAYEWLDLIVNMLGVPESVHCECTAHAPPGLTKTYDTEDFAHATLRFRADRIGALIARRGAVTPSRQLSLFGPNGEMHGSFTLTPRRQDEASPQPADAQQHAASTYASGIALHRRQDKPDRAAEPSTITHVPVRPNSDESIAASINAFSAALRGETRRLPAPAIEHVNTLAVIQAAYLSAKTGAPESPRQFLTG